MNTLPFALPFGFSVNKWLLIAGNMLFGGMLVMLANTGVLPFSAENFAFFSFLLLLIALYRPGWVFLLFIGMLPYEIINLAPAEWGLALRPYQWIAAVLLTALGIRSLTKRLKFDFLHPRWFDALPVIMACGAFFAAINAPSAATALKQAIILTSFVLIYFLCRVFWQTTQDVIQALPFFVGSSLVVFAYSLWQNIRFRSGMESFQVMAGRPNATFSEADWLGLYVMMVLVAACILLSRILSEHIDAIKYETNSAPRAGILSTRVYFPFFFTVFAFIVLIISVVRSAWLASFVAMAVFSWLLFWWQGMKKTIVFGGVLAAAFFIALGSTLAFQLTSFDLFNRAQSTASGLQKITVACESDIIVPAKIERIEELAPLGCRHIDLEAIDAERSAGYIIKEVYRDDPNVAIRRQVYGEVRQLLREHAFLGIGWGSAAVFLGTDERGAGLNASNMFLEFWLGSGLIGFAAFMVFWFAVPGVALYKFFVSAHQVLDRLLLAFVMTAWTGITVFNLFNSGVLLGFFFAYLALGALAMERSNISVS